MADPFSSLSSTIFLFYYYSVYRIYQEQQNKRSHIASRGILVLIFKNLFSFQKINFIEFLSRHVSQIKKGGKEQEAEVKMKNSNKKEKKK